MADVPARPGLVKPITGPGLTGTVGTELTDLGIARRDATRGLIACMFGDSFSYSWGQDWRSPVIIFYDDDLNPVGVPTAGAGVDRNTMAPQLWDYPHNNPDYSTVLPCDFIQVGNVWYVAVMLTQGLGNERITEFWRSTDLHSWTRTDPFIQLRHPGHPGNVMLTFDDGGDGYVYIAGTGGLARNKPIWLWRCAAATFPAGHWEPYGFIDGHGWQWGAANETTPIIGGRYGELCLRRIQGNWVLSFFDAARYSCSALTVPNITDNWANANRLDYAHGADHPQLYGGYIIPGTRLNEPSKFRALVSQWNTATNWPYRVSLFAGTLTAKGPLTDDDRQENPAMPPVVKRLRYNPAGVPQETGYWCGPASAQIVLQGAGLDVPEATLAEECGTDRDGTDYVGLIERCLDARLPDANYTSIDMPHDPPTPAEYDNLWADLVKSIDAGYGVVMNWVAPPNNKPQGVLGSPTPRYSGGTTYHYVAAMGYTIDAAAPGGRAVWIADPGFRPNEYWVSFHQCATLIPPKAYAYANVDSPRPPRPTEPPEIGTIGQQELIDLMLRELSASGSTSITTPEGAKLTLREAVEQTFWKARGWHDLAGRPRHPGKLDDQLGHILSMRADLLFLEALVVAIADHLKLDSSAIYAAVQASISPEGD